ncbi:hypothetical protein BJ912DRAFT_902501 [Pholiota molesta]|nr:hypothetical protein BJ912DRAFT_902501 [Pholiota molesta]
MTTTSQISQVVTPAAMTPLTPMRRFLGKFDLVRPIFSLGKRTRENTAYSTAADCRSRQDTFNHLENSLSEDISSSPPQIIERARVALQQDDEPFDAIVITTLPCYPFCCHEDLLLMSRQQLINVAATFNARLPHVMKIEISDTVSDAHIRHCIERLAGIVPDIPAAPRRIRSWLDKKRKESEDPQAFLSSKIPQLDKFPSPPASPLAMRASRRRSFTTLISTPPRMLERLDEEDEKSEERPLKKRKVSDVKATPTRFLYEHVGIDMDISPAHQSESAVECERLLATPKENDKKGERTRSIPSPTPGALIHGKSDAKVLELRPPSHRMDVEDAARMDIG